MEGGWDEECDEEGGVREGGNQWRWKASQRGEGAGCGVGVGGAESCEVAGRAVRGGAEGNGYGYDGRPGGGGGHAGAEQREGEQEAGDRDADGRESVHLGVIGYCRGRGKRIRRLMPSGNDADGKFTGGPVRVAREGRGQRE